MKDARCPPCGMALITCQRRVPLPAGGVEVDWPDVFRQLLRPSAFEPGPCRRMNVFPGPSGSVKALLSRKSGWLQARTDLPGRLRAGAARRSRASAASVFAGVALLALASCSGSGPAPGGPRPGRIGVSDVSQYRATRGGQRLAACDRRSARCGPRGRRTRWWSSWRTTPTPRSWATPPRRLSTRSPGTARCSPAPMPSPIPASRTTWRCSPAARRGLPMTAAPASSPRRTWPPT